MPGAIVFVVVMVLVIPVAVMLVGAIWTALTGWLFGGGESEAQTVDASAG